MKSLAEVVRSACVEAALAAYEEAGILGLCHEGRWEYALQAIKALDLDRLAAGIDTVASDAVDPGASAEGR
ncbi:MAG: hypothetical protein WCY26_06640 [Thiohalobacteraceae bacterium]|nr:acetyltransferase [Gammaproteobacteria bacterium]